MFNGRCNKYNHFIPMPESKWNPAGEIRMVYKGPPHYRNVLHKDRIEPIITESSFGTKKRCEMNLMKLAYFAKRKALRI